jgi:outer membrane immunogenic protein
MKRILVAGIAAVAVFSAPALAADMPVKSPVYKAPAPVFSWTGCYIGGNAGYGWGRKNLNPGNIFSNGFWESKSDIDGGLLGGQLGCNYQDPGSNWVIGIEGSASAANLKGKGLDGYTGLGTRFYDTAKVTDLASVTGRIGWNGSNPQTLLYAKGGWAWARDKYINGYPLLFYSAKQDRSGWTIGAGWEWAFARNWSAFLEYDHYHFGTKTVVDNQGDDPFPIKQTVDTVKVGVNYRFDWGKSPVVAKY